MASPSRIPPTHKQHGDVGVAACHFGNQLYVQVLLVAHAQGFDDMAGEDLRGTVQVKDAMQLNDMAGEDLRGTVQ
eukprot:1145417-Pelagomonas_calceolata.AAC.4